jgi:hypothetical protein
LASFEGSEFTLEAFGTRHAVAEVSEQLVWLSSALRSSSDEPGAAFAVSLLKHINTTQGTSNSDAIHVFSIYTSIESAPSFHDLPGYCWHSLFRSPVIVWNFPIPVRPQDQTGLEIPLPMMARLLDTNAVHEFNRSLFIKGFSSMLYPTRTSEAIINWHHDFNTSGGYLSYVDHTAEPVKGFGVDYIRSKRHIVGWSKEVKNCTGKSTRL